MNRISQAEVKDLVDYDPLTGVFTRLKSGWKKRVGQPFGTTDTYGYVQIKLSGKLYLAHRVAWIFMYGEWPTGEIDHINGNRSDNRISNLRILSHTENCQNRQKAQSSSVHAKLIGVGFDGRYGKGKFFSNIKTNGKRKYLGSFDTADEAHAAYIKAKKELHKSSFIAMTASAENDNG